MGERKVLFLDPFSGISGDMFLSSLLDCVLNEEEFIPELESFLPSGVKIRTQKTKKWDFTGRTFRVETVENQTSRSLNEIRDLIRSSDLKDEVIRESLQIFETLGEVEASIHGTKKKDVHFHEIGAVDSLADIVGAALAMDHLGFDKLFSAPINTGTGTVDTEHGPLPVPAPATSKLLEKSGAPIYSTGARKELVTPTGASIICHYVESFRRPDCRIESVGRGLGSKRMDHPNFLRVIVGKIEEKEGENLVMMETNIDDMNPELIPPIEEKILSAGALEVFKRPVEMKKNRSGILISVLLPRSLTDTVYELLIRETTTLGVRFHPVERLKTKRETIEVSTQWGEAKAKLAYLNGKVVNVSPEFESCKKIAESKEKPLKDVYSKVRDLASRKFGP